MKDEKQLRHIFCDELLNIAEKDDRVVILEADLIPASGTKPFQEKYPERTFDVGVGEANMMGIAAGLNAMGKVPIATTFTPFATRRAHDQIAISIAYAQLNVIIRGLDPGIAAQLNGGTHMSFEDVGIMRNIPTMTIVEPVDGAQMAAALPKLIERGGPIYLRTYRMEADKIYEDGCEFEIGVANTIREGDDVTIIASGGIMLKNSLDAAEMLKEEGISVRVIDMHTIKPIDSNAIIKAALETGAIVTAENHNIINGLGSAVAEVLIENEPVPMERVGVKDQFGEVGMIPYLAERFELMPIDIAKAAKKVLARKK
jgi:transketolase